MTNTDRTHSAGRAQSAPKPLPISSGDVERLAAPLAAQAWIVAKTMPENPHHYTLRRAWANDADFVWAVERIRRHGYRQKYGKSWYTVLDVDGFFYWTMGWPIGALE